MYENSRAAREAVANARRLLSLPEIPESRRAAALARLESDVSRLGLNRPEFARNRAGRV